MMTRKLLKFLIVLVIILLPGNTSSSFAGPLLQSNLVPPNQDKEVPVALYVTSESSPDIEAAPFSSEVALSERAVMTETLTTGDAEQSSSDWEIQTDSAPTSTSPTRDKSQDVIRTDLRPEETGQPSGLSASISAAAVGFPYGDGFESGQYSGWLDDGGSGTKEATTSTAALGSYSFHYNNITSGHLHGIHQEFNPGSQPTYVSFYIRSGSTSTADAYFLLRSGLNDVIWFYARETGFLYVNANVGGNESYAYNALQWYHIEFRDIDWVDKDFDYYVNGGLVKADVPFRNAGSVNDVDTLYLYNYSSNANAWWDGIYLTGRSMLEDFETGVWPWSPWVEIDAGGTATAACAHDGGRGILDPGWHYRTDVTVGYPGDTLTAWIKPGYGRFYLGFGASSGGAWSLVAAPNTNELIIQQNSGYGYSDLASISQTWSSVWYKLQVIFEGGNVVTGRLYASDGIALLNSVSATLPGFVPEGIAIRGIGSFCADTIAFENSSSQGPSLHSIYLPIVLSKSTIPTILYIQNNTGATITYYRVEKTPEGDISCNNIPTGGPHPCRTPNTPFTPGKYVVVVKAPGCPIPDNSGEVTFGGGNVTRTVSCQ
jgi:hypothetical protein